MLGKSGLVALNLDVAEVAEFVKTHLCVEVIPLNENSSVLAFLFSMYFLTRFTNLVLFVVSIFFTVLILLLF